MTAKLSPTGDSPRAWHALADEPAICPITTKTIMTKFKVFHRTWWRHNPDWPDGLEPCPGRMRHIGYASTLDEAREMCRLWARDHAPGKLADKAEFMEVL